MKLKWKIRSQCKRTSVTVHKRRDSINFFDLTSFYKKQNYLQLFILQV